MRWPDGRESTVHTSALRPLERTPPPPGEITRPCVVGGGEGVAVPKSPPVRSRGYLDWIRRQPCACCDRRAPSEASHHVEPGHGSTSAKTSDLRCLPLCRECHRQYHQHGVLRGLAPAERTRSFVEAEIAAHLTRYLREECGWTGREVNTRLVRVLSEIVAEQLGGRRSA